MNAIFLDVDGVLNSMHTPSWMGDDWDIPLAKHLYQLKRIVDETGAEIVITSSWRTHPYAMRKLELALKVFELPIYGQTPDMNLDRPVEIRMWLAKHSEVDRYVIIDDDPWEFYPDQMDKVVKTSPSSGLTAKKADQAIDILLNEEMWRE